MDWPPIDDPKLASLLAMADDQFAELASKLAARIDRRAYTLADYEHAIGYPWERPDRSFFIGTPSAIHDGEPRFGLVAFGSNASPAVLERKLAGLPHDHRALRADIGWLNDFELVHSAHLSVYGAMPATIRRASGKRVRAALLLVTAEQFAVLTRTEFNYRLIGIDGSAFSADSPGERSSRVFAYVSRHGIYCPARDFNSQAELLDHAAKAVISSDANGADLVRRTIEDYSWAVDVAQPRLAEHAEAFDRSAWDCFSNRREERSS